MAAELTDEPTMVDAARVREADFGPYRLYFELASGGMATVYLARSQGPGGFDRMVALKRIHPHLAKQREFVDMFLDEARLAAQLRHPYLCSVFDFGEVDGTYYIAMELLHGEPISHVVGRLRKKPEERQDPRLPYLWARVFADLCDGLHAAHQAKDDRGQPLKLVHRDISPTNLYVCDDGTVRVLDFGVARAEGRLVRTQTGQLKGKLAYLSPEQLRRKPIDRRHDVWGLGVVAWEAFTRRRLFKRDSEVDTMVAVAQDPIPKASSFAPEVPPELDAILAKALDRDPDQRYQTARELGRALRAFSHSGPEVVDEGDVEAWMSRLFVEERVKRAHLVEIAAQESSGPILRAGGNTDSLETSSVIAADPAGSFAPPPAKSGGLGRRTKLALAVGSGVVLLGALVALALPGDGTPEIQSTPLAPRTVTPAVPSASEAPVLDEEETAGSIEMEPAAEPAESVDDDLEPEEPVEEEVAEAEPVEEEVVEPVVAAEPRTEPAERPSERVEAAAMRRAPAEARAPGELRVITPGLWSEVLVDGESVGRGQAVSVDLPAGSHRVEIRPRGDEASAHRTRVRIGPGATRVLRHSF